MKQTVLKVFSLLTRKEKRELVFLGILMTFMSIVEFMGVISIFPFISVLSNEKLIFENKYFFYIYNLVGFESSRSFIVFLGASVVSTTIAASVVNILGNFKMITFSQALSTSLSDRLIRGYIGRDYSFFLHRNSSDLAKNILSEISQLTIGVLLPLLQGAAKLIIVLILFGLVVWTNYIVALSLSLILGGSYYLIFWKIKPKIFKAGKTKLESNKKRYASSLKAFGGIKEIKLFNNADFFIKEFNESNHEYSQAMIVSDSLGSSPRYFLEVVAFGGIVSVVLVLYLKSGNLSTVLPTISLFALAGYKSLPALQQVYNSLTKIKFSSHSVDVIYQEFKDCEVTKKLSEDKTIFTLENELAIRNLSFTYESSEKKIIQDLSLSIRANSTVGFVGSTGAGKTTLVDLIMGLLRPTAGQIRVDGLDVTADNLKNWQKLISYVPQRIYLSDESVLKNIAFGIDIDKIDFEKVQKVCKMAKIHDFIMNELSDGYNTAVGERGIRISGGQSQRIGIARALYRDPKVLVLDEATSALDNVTESEIVDMIKSINGSCTIIMIAHRLTTVQGCDQIFFLERGKLLGQGTYDNLVEQIPAFKDFARIS
jgi:ABC-type multidrug transport system fused ATPase/permease subunit